MSSVDESRQALGLRLKDIRLAARLTGRRLAELAGWHYTKISKVEHGRTMPSIADLEAWCYHCMAQAELPDLLATVREIEHAYAELRRLHRAGTARFQRDLVERTAKARRFRVFTVNLVPGAFQTPRYAATVLFEATRMLGHPADIEATVSARMERSRLLRSGDRMYHAVILENVLHADVVPPTVMREQLRHILALQRSPNLLLGVLPTGVLRYMPMCEFNIIDDASVEIETFSAMLRVTRPSEIAVYAKVFDHYARLAVYGDAAAAIIRRHVDELEQTGATS